MPIATCRKTVRCIHTVTLAELSPSRSCGCPRSCGRGGSSGATAAIAAVVIILIIIIIIAAVGGGYGWNRVRRDVQLAQLANAPIAPNQYMCQGGGDILWSADLFNKLAGLAPATQKAGWKGIMFDFEYHDGTFDAKAFNAMTKAYKDLHLIVSVTTLQMGPACHPSVRVCGAGAPEIAVDMTGIDWSTIDFLVPQLYYEPPSPNYGFTQTETDAVSANPAWMKSTAAGGTCPDPCTMNITSMVEWWGKTGNITNGHNVTLKSPGYNKIAWGLWKDDIDTFKKTFPKAPQVFPYPPPSCSMIQTNIPHPA